MVNGEQLLLLLALLCAALLSAWVLFSSALPRWVKLYKINTQSLSRVLLPIAGATAIYALLPSVPPIIANFAILLMPRKREELAKLDYAVQERDVGILGPAWVSLYNQIARTGKIPPFAINMSRGAENTLMVVTTLALQRDERLLSAMQAGLRAAERELMVARGQAQSIIVFPYIAVMLSTVGWLAVPLLAPATVEAVGVIRLLQVIGVAIAAAGTEIVHRAMS